MSARDDSGLDRLRGYPVIVDLVVRWADMDALGHVNNVVYHEYFESGRIAYLEHLGYGPPKADSTDYGVIMAANRCRYRAPVTYPDTLSVGVRVSALGDDRFVMEYEAVSRNSGKVVADGDALVVSYNYVEGRKVPLSLEYRDKIIALEGRVPPPVSPRMSARWSVREAE